MTQVSKTDTALAFAELPFWRPFKDNLRVTGQDRGEGGHPTSGDVRGPWGGRGGKTTCRGASTSPELSEELAEVSLPAIA